MRPSNSSRRQFAGFRQRSAGKRSNPHDARELPALGNLPRTRDRFDRVNWSSRPISSVDDHRTQLPRGSVGRSADGEPPDWPTFSVSYGTLGGEAGVGLCRSKWPCPGLDRRHGARCEPWFVADSCADSLVLARPGVSHGNLPVAFRPADGRLWFDLAPARQKSALPAALRASATANPDPRKRAHHVDRTRTACFVHG